MLGRGGDAERQAPPAPIRCRWCRRARRRRCGAPGWSRSPRGRAAGRSAARRALQTSSKVPPAVRQAISTLPSAVDKAPYLTAFVAHSWIAKASDVAAAGPIAASAPVRWMRHVLGPGLENGLDQVVQAARRASDAVVVATAGHVFVAESLDVAADDLGERLRRFAARRQPHDARDHGEQVLMRWLSSRLSRSRARSACRCFVTSSHTTPTPTTSRVVLDRVELLDPAALDAGPREASQPRSPRQPPARRLP